jgi:chloramphenicol O-acetyltransferase type A
MKLFVKKINLSTWKRRQHFELFFCYVNPYWSVTINVGCTKIYQRSKQDGFPFYLGYYYALLRAANTVDAFRQRIENGKPVDKEALLPFKKELNILHCF